VLLNAPLKAGAEHGPTVPLRRREDISELTRAGARQVIVLCAFLLILYYVLYFGLATVPLAVALFIPVVLLGTCFLLASLATLFLVGTLLPHLRMGLRLFGAALFMGTLLISLSGSTEGLALLGGSVLVLGGFVLLTCIVQGYRVHLWIVLRAIALIGAGLVLQFGASLLPRRLEGLGTALLISFALTGLLSLLALFYAHRRSALRLVGGAFRPTLSVLLLGALLSLLFIYLYVFRPPLQAGYDAYVILIEWLAVGIVAAALAIRFYLYFRRRSALPAMGDWTILLQKVTFEEGDLRRATTALRDFIENGRREGAVVLLTSTLLINQVTEERIERILSPIINYQRPTVPLLFRWTYGDLERKLREERVQMISSALAQMAEAVGARYLSSGQQAGREQRVQEA
jgi:hypothetical protein